MKYYSLNRILKQGKDCKYYVIFGERSNGKTHAILRYGLEQYVKTGKQMAIIRRWREDFRNKRGASYFNGLVRDGYNHNVVKELTDGKYDVIVYDSSKWYLAYFDEEVNKYIRDDNPFAYAFAISEMEHDKGNSYRGITTILFDEFLTRSIYLKDEFVLYMNTLSTIIRERDDVKIFMCANTVSQYSPYFTEMGLKNITKMQKGDIAIYKYGNSNLSVAVEFADGNGILGKKSDIYFAFDNPKLQMITGQGQIWELDIYPHITHGIEQKDIIFSYFIQFEDHILQADIVSNDNELFTFIHKKTTDIKKPDDDIIFALVPTENTNQYVSLIVPVDKLTKKICYFYKAKKVFYQDNEIGEIVTQYINNTMALSKQNI